MPKEQIKNTEPTTPPVEDIKFAKPEDITQIVSFGYKSFKENKLTGKGQAPSFSKTVRTITDWVINDAVLVKRNEDNDKFIDGVCAMEVSSTWWSEELALQVGLFYIKPEKRSYKVAKQLLEASKEYAILNGLPLLVDLVGEDSDRQAKLLTRLGFEKLGSAFVFIDRGTK